MPADDHDDLVDRLRAVEEELAERALAVLRDAVESGASGRPDAERRLTRARAAVTKAIGLLEGADTRDAGDTD